jgi:hypothetical protein
MVRTESSGKKKGHSVKKAISGLFIKNPHKGLRLMGYRRPLPFFRNISACFVVRKIVTVYPLLFWISFYSTFSTSLPL